MEFLNILKKHYEKVILSVVLLGLAIAAAMLLLRVAAERERLDEVRRMNLVTAPRAIEPIDVSTNSSRSEPVATPRLRLSLHGTNNLFNPVQWQRRADQRLDKIVTGDETGPGALRITDIKPLYLLIILRRRDSHRRPPPVPVPHRTRGRRVGRRTSRCHPLLHFGRVPQCRSFAQGDAIRGTNRASSSLSRSTTSLKSSSPAMNPSRRGRLHR
jgi:hypothetical protein